MLVTNAAHMPIAVVVLSGELSIADVDTLGAFYTKVHERDMRFATIVDARRVKVPGAPVRRALGDMSNQFDARSEKNMVLVATILDSKVLVGALTAVRWFLKNPVDLRYFASAKEALRTIEERFALEKIAVPAPSRAFMERLDGAADIAAFAD